MKINKLILLLLLAAMASPAVAQRRTTPSSKYTSSAQRRTTPQTTSSLRRTAPQTASSTVKRIVNNSQKGYEWVRSSKSVRKKEFFPHELEYSSFESHPQFKVINDFIFNQDGRLTAVAYMPNDFLHGGRHRAEYKEALITALEISSYAKNAYGVDKATEEERTCIEHRLFDVRYDGSVHRCVDKAEGYVAQLRLDAENLTYGYVQTITRLSPTAFRVQFADVNWNPTFNIRVDYKPDGDFKYKEIVTYDGMSFSNKHELLTLVKQAIGFDETKYRRTPNSASGQNDRRTGQSHETVYDVVEQQPKFNGDLNAWLRNNLKYPAVASENGIEGRVIVQFVVRTDGSISDITVVRGVDAELDKEAKRVVETMPLWTPGRQNGQPVNCKFTMPVVFKLQ